MEKGIWMVAAVAVLVVAFAITGGVLFAKRAKKEKHFSIESLVGVKGTVTEKVENLAGSGLVRTGDYSFAARALEEDAILEPGTRVEIVAVEGVKLICRAAK